MRVPQLLVVGTIALAASASNVAAQGCVTEARSGRHQTHQNLSRNDDGGRQLTVRWRWDDCELRVDARGDFGVRGDLTGFTTVAQGGYVEIEEIDGRRRRKVRVTNDGRALQYRWTLNGNDGFDVNPERWLSDILLALELRTAMFSKTRVPELVRQGGPAAVLDVTSRMESDWARRQYYVALIGSTRLDDTTLEQLLRQAGGSMTSDFERAELLRTLAKQGPMSDRVTRAAIDVAHRMSSDFEKRRALSAGLESVATPGSRLALFNAASTLTSDFELAELLIAAQRRNLVDSVSADAYFRAVEELSSDFERRRTLTALLKQRPESNRVLTGLLRASASINSDFELASLLVDFARTVPVRGELRELYLKATRTINSDWEYRRAVQALVDQDRTS
jgi:hypothetical protein